MALFLPHQVTPGELSSTANINTLLPSDDMQPGVISGVAPSVVSATRVVSWSFGWACVQSSGTDSTGGFDVSVVPTLHRGTTNLDNTTRNTTLSTSTAGTSRLDQLIMYKPEFGLSNGVFTVVAVTGVEQSGTSTVTLDNRTGAIADTALNTSFPYGWIRIADLLVVNTAGTYATTFRDRRPWAQGYYSRIILQGVSNITTASSGWTAMDGAFGTSRLSNRGEITSGNAVKMTLQGQLQGTFTELRLWNGYGQQWGTSNLTDANATTFPVYIEEYVTGLSGTQSFVPQWHTLGATSTLLCTGQAAGGGGTFATVYIVEELLRSSSNNGTT